MLITTKLAELREGALASSGLSESPCEGTCPFVTDEIGYSSKSY